MKKMSEKEIIAAHYKKLEKQRFNQTKRQLIYEKAVAQGITVTDAEVNARLAKNK